MKALTHRRTIWTLLLILGVCLAPWAIRAAEKAGEKEDKEESIALDQLPAPVRAAIEAEAKGGKIGEVEKADDGVGAYEADIVVDGKEIELTLDADGKILKKEADDEDKDDDDDEKKETLTLDQVPAAVKATIEAEAKGGKIEEIEKSDDVKDAFEADVKIDGKDFELTIAPDGKLLKKEADDEDDDDDDAKKLTLDQVPAEIKKSLEFFAAGAQITGIEEEKEDGKTIYEADLLKDKEKSEVKVDADGKLISRDVDIALEKAPDAVQAALKLEIKDGGLPKEIEQETLADNKVNYSADVVIEKKKFEITFDAEGKVIKREEEKEKKKGKDDDDDDEKDEKDEVKIPLDQLPAAVRATVEAEATGGKVEDVEKSGDGYEADVIIDGKEIELKIAADGKLIKKQADEEEDDDKDDDKTEKVKAPK